MFFPVFKAGAGIDEKCVIIEAVDTRYFMAFILKLHVSLLFAVMSRPI